MIRSMLANKSRRIAVAASVVAIPLLAGLALWAFFWAAGTAEARVAHACARASDVQSYDLLAYAPAMQGHVLRTEVRRSGRKYHAAFTLLKEGDATETPVEQITELLLDGEGNRFTRTGKGEWSVPEDDTKDLPPFYEFRLCPEVLGVEFEKDVSSANNRLGRYKIITPEPDTTWTVWISEGGWLSRVEVLRLHDDADAGYFAASYLVSGIGETNAIEVPSTAERPDG